MSSIENHTCQIEEGAAPGGAAPAERKSAQTLGNCKPENLEWLQSLVQLHRARGIAGKTRLKNEDDKRLIKQIYSLMQGFDSKIAECYCGCAQKWEIDDMEVHHIDNNPSHNQIENTAATTPRCNKRLNGRLGAIRNQQRGSAHRRIFSDVALPNDRENAGHTRPHEIPAGHEPQWASKEGANGEIMRKAFNEWRRKGHGGWMRRGEIQRVSHIAAKAVYACSDKPGEPFGSDQTYAKYIQVDAINGIYDTFKERGVWMAQYVGELDDAERLTEDEILASQNQWYNAGGAACRDVIVKEGVSA